MNGGIIVDRATDRPTSALVASGLMELAAGALTGWIYTATRSGMGAGTVDPTRIRQWHLDLAMLGTATVAAGVAVPDAPRAVQTALGVGAWTNAMLFLPMAFRDDLEKTPTFKVAAVGSFVLTSVGFTGMAIAALRGRR